MLFLLPSINYCLKQLDWVPDIVVGDMAYINLQKQKFLREKHRVALVTKIRADMNMPKCFEPGPVLICDQGQTLDWLGLDPHFQEHWFGVLEKNPLCSTCWEQHTCPKQFSFKPSEHEILFGSIPLSSRVARRLLGQARSWIEATQSYEKHQLGLADLFLNSLRLTWFMGLLSDTVLLLRANARMGVAEPKTDPLNALYPTQMDFGLD